MEKFANAAHARLDALLREARKAWRSTETHEAFQPLSPYHLPA
jgi:hypothetical protein